MKKTFPFLIILALLISCKKDNDITDIKNNITGKWETESNSCGLCNTSFTNYLPGNGNFIIISENGNFERKIHDTLLFKGSYSILKNKDCNKSSGDFAFTTNEQPISSIKFITINNDKLTLSTPYCYQDGSVTTYRRIN